MDCLDGLGSEEGALCKFGQKKYQAPKKLNFIFKDIEVYLCISDKEYNLPYFILTKETKVD